MVPWNHSCTRFGVGALKPLSFTRFLGGLRRRETHRVQGLKAASAFPPWNHSGTCLAGYLQTCSLARVS